jgi:hypothetical protein
MKEKNKSGKNVPGSGELLDLDSFQRDDNESEMLINMIRDMPDRDPPPGLAAAIAEGLKPKKPPLLSRFGRRFAGPNMSRRVSSRLILAGAFSLFVLLLVIYITGAIFPIENNSSENQKLQTISFSLAYAEARSVSLIGSFNQWKPKGFELYHDKNTHRWCIQLELPPGRHVYAFLVDGKIVADPNSQFKESDGYGNNNSIRYVSDVREQSI